MYVIDYQSIFFWKEMCLGHTETLFIKLFFLTYIVLIYEAFTTCLPVKYIFSFNFECLDCQNVNAQVFPYKIFYAQMEKLAFILKAETNLIC